MIEMEPPAKEVTEKHRKPSIEERIKDALCMCESGHESREEWDLLRRVNNALMSKKKLSKRQQNLL
jgi:hypothetical protein